MHVAPRTRLLALTGTLALTLTIAVAAVAAGGPRGALAAPGTPTTGSGTTMVQGGLADFYAKLAANLGIGQDKLVAAVAQTDQQQIDAAVAAGTLTPAQAQLQQDLLTAGSPQGVAAKYGQDNATNKAALQAALVAALRQDLTTKGVATAQVEQEVTEFTQNFDQFYTGTRGQRVPKPATSPVPSASPAVSQ